MNLCQFKIADVQYGIPILHVQEYLEHPEWSSLPDNDYHLVGTLNLRGKIIPIINLNHLLNDDERRGSLVIVLRGENNESDDDQYGLLVDSRLPIQDERDFKVYNHQSETNSSYIHSLLKRDEEVIHKLKIPSIIQAVLP